MEAPLPQAPDRGPPSRVDNLWALSRVHVDPPVFSAKLGEVRSAKKFRSTSTPDLISHFSACSAFPRDDGLSPQALVPDPAFAA
jgi:hypothetical protein